MRDVVASGLAANAQERMNSTGVRCGRTSCHGRGRNGFIQWQFQVSFVQGLLSPAATPAMFKRRCAQHLLQGCCEILARCEIIACCVISV